MRAASCLGWWPSLFMYNPTMRQPESRLVRGIKQQVKARGGRSFKIHGEDEGFQEVGIPDLLICYHGRFVGGEVKQPGAELRPRQKMVLREIFNSCGVAAVLETVEQAESLLSYLEKEDELGKSTGLCFNRGLFSRDHCDFSPRN
jgi:hypothetical protein